METGKPMVDVILDKAGQKGTGKWTSQNVLDLGISTHTIAEAVFVRCISSVKVERMVASKILKGLELAAFDGDKKEFIESVRRALYLSKICSYAQGFALMKAAAKEYGWNLNYGNVAMIFREKSRTCKSYAGSLLQGYNRKISECMEKSCINCC